MTADLSPTEAATVARFEAGEPAPESWGGDPLADLGEVAQQAVADASPRNPLTRGLTTLEDDRLRDLLMAPLSHVMPASQVWGAADALLPVVTAWHEEQIAALRAKADGADRVRELAEEWDRQAPEQEAWDGNVVAAYADIADRIRRALDGPDRTDRGRC